MKDSLNRLYVDKILSRPSGQKSLVDFIDANLRAEDRYVPLAGYVGLMARQNQRIVQAAGHYPHRFELSPDTHVMPLPMKDGQYGTDSGLLKTPANSLFPSERRGQTTSLHGSFVLTEKREAILLKCRIYSDIVEYYALRLDFEEDKPFLREAFLIRMFPEFFAFLHQPDALSQLAHMKNIMFENSVKYITHYSAQFKQPHDDLALIKQGLLSRCSGYGDLAVRKKGKFITIQAGSHDRLTIQLVECKLVPEKDKYKTNSGVTFKNDIDAIILKAHDPEDDAKIHYVYVTNFMNPRLDKDGRIWLNAYFSKRNGTYELTEEGIHRKNEYRYTAIDEVMLWEE